MNEFQLIDEVLAVLGGATRGPSVRVGPGDDCAVTSPPDGFDVASSIDALVADRHFPADGPDRDIGYRAVMVSVSDLLAMGAEPAYLLVALTLPDAAQHRSLGFAQGMKEAAERCGAAIVGGNLARGALSLAVSVHGYVRSGAAVLRSGAAAGDDLYVTGELGGAAAAVRRQFADAALNDRFYRPALPLETKGALCGVATSAIDVSDGLLQDVGHIARASGVGFDLESAAIPVASGAQLDDALRGGDDYQICFTANQAPPFAATRIGRATTATELTLDGERVAAEGFQHFA